MAILPGVPKCLNTLNKFHYKQNNEKRTDFTVFFILFLETYIELSR